MVDSQTIDKAVEALRSGKLVAIPTETVYGLGADASNAKAVQKIYELKGRPSNHPLIVHVQAPLPAPIANSLQLEQDWISILAPWTRHIPETALILIKYFWPGPLTLVFERGKSVLDCVTGGQETIAIRSPAHPLTQGILRAFGGGIAAPSANRYGRISPTTAADVRSEFPQNPELLILDGGPCEHGIESTILNVSEEGNPKLLRPGTITPSQIKTATGIEVVVDHHQHSQSPRVSGSHQAHYAPYTPLFLYHEGDVNQQIREQSKKSSKKIALIVWTDCFDLYRKNFANVSAQLELLSVEKNPKQFGQILYRLLRDLDQKNFGAIFIPNPPLEESWDAVRDRLQRASFGSGPSSSNQISS